MYVMCTAYPCTRTTTPRSGLWFASTRTGQWYVANRIPCALTRYLASPYGPRSTSLTKGTFSTSHIPLSHAASPSVQGGSATVTAALIPVLVHVRLHHVILRVEPSPALDSSPGLFGTVSMVNRVCPSVPEGSNGSFRHAGDRVVEPRRTSVGNPTRTAIPSRASGQTIECTTRRGGRQEPWCVVIDARMRQGKGGESLHVQVKGYLCTRQAIRTFWADSNDLRPSHAGLSRTTYSWA